jgi:hypothetical protein
MGLPGPLPATRLAGPMVLQKVAKPDGTDLDRHSRERGNPGFRAFMDPALIGIMRWVNMTFLKQQHCASPGNTISDRRPCRVPRRSPVDTFYTQCPYPGDPPDIFYPLRRPKARATPGGTLKKSLQSTACRADIPPGTPGAMSWCNAGALAAGETIGRTVWSETIKRGFQPLGEENEEGIFHRNGLDAGFIDR